MCKTGQTCQISTFPPQTPATTRAPDGNPGFYPSHKNNASTNKTPPRSGVYVVYNFNSLDSSRESSHQKVATMPSEPSIHDNIILAYTVNCEERTLVLQTVFRGHPKDAPHQYTDIVFRDVIAHQFEHVLPANILFDVEEAHIAQFVRDNATIFNDSWRNGWPPVIYNGDLNTLIDQLKSTATRAFIIGSSYGLSGWVLAGSCQRIPRQ